MSNYLNDSISYGGTNEGIDIGYWTISNRVSIVHHAWFVRYDGIVNSGWPGEKINGVRPVIVIKK